MTAETLDEAIEIQNQVDYGLTAGHPHPRPGRDRDLARPRPGRQPLRQPWHHRRDRPASAVRWLEEVRCRSRHQGRRAELPGRARLLGVRTLDGRDHGLSPVADRLLRAADDLGLAPWQLDFLTRSFASDALAWRDEFGQVKDVSELTAERNLFRYVPTPVLVRLADDTPLPTLVRVVGAGLLAGSDVTVSTPAALPTVLRAALAELGVSVATQPEREWLQAADTIEHARVRLIGAPASSLARAAGGRPDLAGTPTASPKRAGSSCCRSSRSRPSASRHIDSARLTTSPTGSSDNTDRSADHRNDATEPR